MCTYNVHAPILKSKKTLKYTRFKTPTKKQNCFILQHHRQNHYTTAYAQQNLQWCFLLCMRIRASVTKIEFKSYVERIKIFMENIVHLSTTTNVGLASVLLQRATKNHFSRLAKILQRKAHFRTYHSCIFTTEPTTIICARTKV